MIAGAADMSACYNNTGIFSLTFRKKRGQTEMWGTPGVIRVTWRIK